MIYLFDCLDSTNQYALDHLSELEDGDVILAREQSAGRGRHGHVWHASKDQSMLASFVLKKNLTYEKIMHLSSYAGYILADILRANGVKAWIKYPNDIYVDDRKLAGILVETKANGAVIGIGVNLYGAPLEMGIALCNLMKNPFSADVLAKLIVDRLYSEWFLFERLDQLYERINAIGYLNGKEINTTRLGKIRILSIDSQGRIHYLKNDQEYNLFVHELTSH